MYLIIILFSFNAVCRLVREFTSLPKLDHRLTETEAGRIFLEMLRQHDDIDVEINNEYSSTTQKNVVDVKTKRNALRNTLEDLIVEYLKDLNTDSEEYLEEFTKRQKRSVTNNKVIFKESNENREMDETAEVFDDSGGEKWGRFEIGVRNISVSKILYEIRDHKVMENVINKRSECTGQFRKISSLSQFDLDSVQQNVTDSEHNIRRVLNSRLALKYVPYNIL